MGPEADQAGLEVGSALASPMQAPWASKSLSLVPRRHLSFRGHFYSPFNHLENFANTRKFPRLS